jgi:D-alanyl-D-alanine dipeptidase
MWSSLPRLLYPSLLSVFLFSCREGDNSDPKNLEKNESRDGFVQLNDSAQKSTQKPATSSMQLPSGLVDVQSINPNILIDLKYTGVNNFLNQRLYFRLNKAYLQQDVAQRLSKVQAKLEREKPGFHLLIFDALRPVSVQEKMWSALDSLPPVERAKFVSNPKNRSLHNFGAAVDISIQDANGNLLDMGAGFDDIRKIAYPNLEDSFLRAGLLSPKQLSNRLLLRRLMQSEGFRQLPTEWWHFNACSRNEAKQKYAVVLTEP